MENSDYIHSIGAIEALRSASGWLKVQDLPGSAAAQQAIASVTPLVMSGEISPRDLDDLASIVEHHGRPFSAPGVPLDVHLTQLGEAVRSAFERVENQRS